MNVGQLCAELSSGPHKFLRHFNCRVTEHSSPGHQSIDFLKGYCQTISPIASEILKNQCIAILLWGEDLGILNL